MRWFNKILMVFSSLSVFLAAEVFAAATITSTVTEADDSRGAVTLTSVVLTEVPAEVVYPHLTSDSPFAERERALLRGRTFSIDGIALFAGTDPFSKAIKKCTASAWSHVGLIVRDERGQKYCFESTGSATDILKEHVLPQAQIHRWEDIIRNYDGVVAERAFTFSTSATSVVKDATSFVCKNVGKPYEQSFQTLFASIKRGNKSDDLTSVFCSELVAECLIEAGILPLHTERLAQNYLPRDFGGSEFLPLASGIALSPEFLHKEPKTTCGCWCF
jgi:hypothetical protein